MKKKLGIRTRRSVRQSVASAWRWPCTWCAGCGRWCKPGRHCQAGWCQSNATGEPWPFEVMLGSP